MVIYLVFLESYAVEGSLRVYIGIRMFRGVAKPVLAGIARMFVVQLRIADAVGENSFEMVANLLEHDISILHRLMKLGSQSVFYL